MKKTPEKIVEEVAGTMAIENMHLSPSEKKTLLSCAENKISCRATVDKLIEEYARV
ncbi:hypothetical protein M2140_001838 [Clostridiales Family XIII bacterium PM5-7]